MRPPFVPPQFDGLWTDEQWNAISDEAKDRVWARLDDEFTRKYPLPDWKQTADGAYYSDDAKEHNFLLHCQLFFGFDVVEFDHWLANLEPCNAKFDLLEGRYEAFMDGRFGSTPDESPVKHRLDALYMKMSYIRREDALLPLARHGRSFRDTQAAKGRLRWANPHDDLKNGIIAMLAKRKDVLGDPLPPNELWGPFFAELEDKGLHPVDNGDDAYLWDGGRITYDAFRKQVARNR